MRAQWLIVGLVLITSTASAQSMLVRSDLPLWSGDDNEAVWPHNFNDGVDFGCATILQGRYAYRDIREPAQVVEAGLGEPNQWIEFENRSAMHCALVMTSTTPESPEYRSKQVAFLVELGDVSGSDKRALVALQIGMRGGSEYWLMARPPGPPSLGASYDVLDPVCPSRLTRRARFLSVFRTEYCAVHDRTALRRLARDAARRPIAGRLTFVAAPPDGVDPQN